MIKLLESGDLEYAKFVVAEALGLLKDKRAVEPLIRVLDDKDKLARAHAAEALGLIRDERATEPLLKTLRDKERDVRSKAGGALRRIGAPVVKPLIEFIKKEEEGSDIYREASATLQHMRDKEAIPLLIEALKDEKERIRSYAAFALKGITRQKFGTDYAKWKAWYEKNKDK